MSRKQSRAGLVLCLLALSGMLGLSASATNYYVDAARPDDTGDGLSWSTAKKTIQAGVDLAASSADTVYVADGVYTQGGAKALGALLTNRVCLTRPIHLESVNGAQYTTIQGAPDPTYLDGLGARAIRRLYATTGATVKGFTLVNGYTKNLANNMDSRGGGALLFTNAVLENSRILTCSARYGGGVHLREGGTLSKSEVVGNFASHSGAGALIYDGGIISECLFTTNRANSAGAAATWRIPAWWLTAPLSAIQPAPTVAV